MIYKPTDEFNVNTKMIEDILEDITRGIGGPAGKVSATLCIVVKGNNEEEENFGYVFQFGDSKILAQVFSRMAKGEPIGRLVKHWGSMPDS